MKTFRKNQVEGSYGVHRKLRCFGHIIRKEDESLEKCVITGMVEGTRGRGRSQRAWCDDSKEVERMDKSVNHRRRSWGSGGSADPPLFVVGVS